MKPIVAIVGRPNVGKSALFNRLCGGRVAIVEGTPGVTRDRIYGSARWLEREFIVVDTGGIEGRPEDLISQHVRRQAELAIESADVILFVVDGRDGLVAGDEEVAEMLRRSDKPVVLAVNKIDDPSPALLAGVYEFARLGLGEPIPISAEHGRNIGDLLSRVSDLLPEEGEDERETDVIRATVIGRPNVGKSSWVNAVLGEERMIVTDTPGTTRDAVDVPFTYKDRSFQLIDTAGLRRKGKVTESVEYYSVVRALRAVERSDVAIVMLDATELVTDQDKRVAGIPHEAGRGIVLAVNKWDAVEKDSKTMQRFEDRIRQELAFVSYAPIVFISALTGQRVERVLDQVIRVSDNRAMRIPTGRLNQWLRAVVQRYQPPAVKGVQGRIYYASQVGIKPPQFVFFVNDPDVFHFSYMRHLENELRAEFGFEGTPIRFILRPRSGS